MRQQAESASLSCLRLGRPPGSLPGHVSPRPGTLPSVLRPPRTSAPPGELVSVDSSGRSDAAYLSLKGKREGGPGRRPARPRRAGCGGGGRGRRLSCGSFQELGRGVSHRDSPARTLPEPCDARWTRTLQSCGGMRRAVLSCWICSHLLQPQVEDKHARRDTGCLIILKPLWLREWHREVAESSGPGGEW